MRYTAVFDVAEVQIHDHFIRRRPGAPSRFERPRLLESPEGLWERFAWPQKAAPEHVDDPGLWMMAYSHHGYLDKALAMADKPTHPKVDALAMYHHARGSLLERTGRGGDARLAYEAALERDPDLAPAAINLARLYGGQGEPQRGLDLLESVLATHPEAVGALRNRAGLRYESGDQQGFIDDLLKAFELHPAPDLAQVLADWFEYRKEPQESALWRARARELTPLAAARATDHTGHEHAKE